MTHRPKLEGLESGVLILKTGGLMVVQFKLQPEGFFANKRKDEQGLNWAVFSEGNRHFGSEYAFGPLFGLILSTHN